eukprot:311801-Hanusia_phi.AAC.1
MWNHRIVARSPGSDTQPVTVLRQPNLKRPGPPRHAVRSGPGPPAAGPGPGPSDGRPGPAVPRSSDWQPGCTEPDR